MTLKEFLVQCPLFANQISQFGTIAAHNLITSPRYRSYCINICHFSAVGSGIIYVYQW
ncbi:MAG TPA: hypothetical protein VHV32_04290 [Candidatus Angelobacter sp.]|nr:hypothetical protein [Candidatus Angelobacter sp.]